MAAHIARAAVEGVLCGLADCLDALMLHGARPERLLLVGGAVRSQGRASDCTNGVQPASDDSTGRRVRGLRCGTASGLDTDFHTGATSMASSRNTDIPHRSHSIATSTLLRRPQQRLPADQQLTCGKSSPCHQGFRERFSRSEHVFQRSSIPPQVRPRVNASLSLLTAVALGACTEASGRIAPEGSLVSG
jgi:hypothetical protein